jgi:hypothetical protein
MVTPTPTPEVTPTPTSTPEVTPTPTVAPTPTPTLIDLSAFIDGKGVLQQPVQYDSPDGMLGLDIGNGTTALTGGGEPLQTIELQPISDIPLPPADCHIIGLAYDFGPDGATFTPSIIITLAYDPSLCPEGVAEEDLTIAYFDVETGKWVECECEVDIVNNIITAHVSHFTMFAVMAEVPMLPLPPAPTQVSWSLIGGIIGGALVVLGLGTYLFVTRKKGTPSET